MAFFKFMQGDNRILTYGLLLAAVWIAFYTILARINTDPVFEEKVYAIPEVTEVSFIKLKLGMTQAMLKRPFVPEFSDQWEDNPKVQVNWHMYCRGDREFTGTATALLKPPYDNIVFSVQNDLLDTLDRYHSERIFLIEARNRMIREVYKLDIEIVHPETGAVLERFTQRYVPEQRPYESWAY